MACPFSNTLLGGLDGVTLDTFVGDYYQPSVKHGYNFIHATVTAIDRKSKTVTTTSGDISYDILVLSPGIAYDYEKQFPKWSKEKIAQVAQACPAALMPGNEHIALKRQLDNMDDGNVIIVPPAKGKYRLEIDDAIEYQADEAEEENEKLLKMTERYNQALEKIIRAHPAQWFWVHDRWNKRV
jgi:NADPH-dependent 2,4-dienoyl-CoA reductase/sulfur reductase-like enzyme